MSYGILAILDDIAALAKMASASLDDIAAQSLQAGTKSLGIVIDDAAVTPSYVTDMSPARELPAIVRIAKWSLFNKIVVITPLALLLTTLMPWIITPLLTLGGLYLAFEGAEKVLEVLGLHAHHDPHEDAAEAARLSPAEREKVTVSGAIRTDFILSSEIMVLTLAGVAEKPLITQLGVMIAIAIAFTFGVYGVVAMIVRADDVGLALARNKAGTALGRMGGALVRHVPGFLKLLGAVGTLAMLWVGGSLIVHGLAQYHIEAPEHLIHEAAHAAAQVLPAFGGAISWAVTAALSGLVALAAGSALAGALIGAQGLRKG